MIQPDELREGLDALHEYTTNKLHPPASAGTVVWGVRLPAETKDAFVSAARALGESPGDVGRRLIAEWLEQVTAGVVVEWTGEAADEVQR